MRIIALVLYAAAVTNSGPARPPFPARRRADPPLTSLPAAQENNAMSKKNLPPVPPAGRSNKGPDAAKDSEPVTELAANKGGPRDRNTDKQSRQGNIAANTRNQGYQQDR